ncbi:MAG: S1C family serine protease [Planctomycetota bacterium]|nr:S1C family serine protease [Planctomycetota bacterium]
MRRRCDGRGVRRGGVAAGAFQETAVRTQMTTAVAAIAALSCLCLSGADVRAGDAAPPEPSASAPASAPAATPAPPAAPAAVSGEMPPAHGGAGASFDEERACPEAFRRALSVAEKYIVEINTAGGIRTGQAAAHPAHPSLPPPHPAPPTPPSGTPAPSSSPPALPKSGEKPPAEGKNAPAERKGAAGEAPRTEGSPRAEGGGDGGRREAAKGPPKPAPRPVPVPNRRRPGGGGFRPGDGPTTGIIVSSDGLILTSSFNFAARPQIVTVTLPDGSVYPAEVLGRDIGRNLCLLRIPARDLPVPEFADPAALKVGQWAISLGWGYEGDRPAVSVGIVSALNRFSGRVVQTDAKISPANYGGPLVDIEGRIIGICVPLSPADRSETAGVEWYDSGIGFAVPLAGLEAIIARMAKGETVRPARLGVVPDASYNASSGSGVRIERIEPGSPAERAGLRTGDIVLSVGGRPVRGQMDLRVEIGRRCAGDKVKVRYSRDGAESEAEIELTEEAAPGVPGRLAPPTPGNDSGETPR